MQRESWGMFAHRKWRTKLAVHFPDRDGKTLRVFEWDNAILDTGSPTHIIPGIAPAYTDRSQAAYPQLLDVGVRTGAAAGLVPIWLPHNGLFPIPISGAESSPRYRFEFWAHLCAPEIPRLGDSPFIFMDIPHPVISVGQCLEEGGRFVFEQSRFLVRQ